LGGDEEAAINMMSLIIKHVCVNIPAISEACGRFTVGRSGTNAGRDGWKGDDFSCNEIDFRTGIIPISSTEVWSITMTGRSEDESEAFRSRCIDFLTAEKEEKRGTLGLEGLAGVECLLGPNGRRDRRARKPDTPAGLVGEEGPGVLKEGRLVGRSELLDGLVGIDEGV
jgi:hypothetical protein